MTEVATQHGPECECTRCRGFTVGNQLARKHGAKSLLALSSRAAEIREEVEAVAPVVHESDGPILDLASMCMAQVEAAMIVFSGSRREQLDALAAGQRLSPEQLVAHARLAQDCRGWVNTTARLLSAMGMSATARASLGLDLVSTRHRLSLIELHELAAAERAAAGADVDGDATEEGE